MAQFKWNVKNYIKKITYLKDELDNLLNGKADSNHEHGDLYYTENEIDTQMDTKVDKVTGKGLSTEDFTTAEKNKLANLENTTVDAALDATSENPVQNSTIYSALNGKVDKVNGKGLSTEDFTTAEKSKLANLENTTVDSALSTTSENPVQNKVIKNALDNHSHSAGDVTDSSAYSNLETAANASQSTINSAIDSKIGSLLSIELITVVDNLPSASADTMNKMYLVAEESAKTDDAYEIFITVKSGNNYNWEKVDTARIDLSGYMQTANFNPAFDEDTGELTIEY